jgi:hypothetical protein
MRRAQAAGLATVALAAAARVAIAGPAVVGDDVSAGAVVAMARPDLVPPATLPTTRAVADTTVVGQHPTHARGDDFTIDTYCRGTVCVEELRLGGHVAIGHAAALARLRAATSDPGHDDDTDATEVLAPQPSAPGWRSLYRIESDFTRGAAHARTSMGCETYRVATGRRAALRDVVGARAARRALAAATAALATDGRDGLTVSPWSFLVPAAGTVELCATRAGDSATITPIVVTATAGPAKLSPAPRHLSRSARRCGTCRP